MTTPGGRLAALVAASAVFGIAVGDAQAAITPTTDAAAVGQAIVADPSTFVSGTWLAQPANDPSAPPPPPASSAAVVTAALDGFPTAGPTFGLLTTGDPTLADQPNNAANDGYDWGVTNADHGDTARDATVLRIGVNVPAGATCMALDYRFLSEEFPEFVGSQFNDAFIAQVDRSDWTTSGSEISKPGDFATTADGRPVSVNGVGPFAVSEGEATGTTYDAATGRVTTKTPITPGAHQVVLSIFDQSDGIYDSAVFVDNLRFVTEDASTCLPPAVAATPAPAPTPEPAAAPAPGPVPAPAPSNTFTVGSSITFGANGTGTMTITVPGPGVVTAADAGTASARAAGVGAAAAKKKAKPLVKPVRVVVTKAGKVKLSIKPTPAGRKVLNKKRKLTVRLRVTYTPTGGTARSQIKKVTLRLKAKAHH